MQTWLDWVVLTAYRDAVDTADLAKPILAELGPEMRAVLDKAIPEAKGATPLAFMREFIPWVSRHYDALVFGDMERLAEEAERRLRRQLTPEMIRLVLAKAAGAAFADGPNKTAYAGYDGQMICFLEVLAPHLSGAPGPLALRVSDRLVETLREARAPVSEQIDAVLRSRPLYLDLPHGALLMGEHLQVRAVAVAEQETVGGTRGLCASAALTRPGRNAVECVVSWGLDKPSVANSSHPLPGCEISAAATEITEFVRLVVAYAAVAEPNTRKPVAAVDDRRLKTDRNWRATTKKFSLFRVLDVDAPKDRFGRAADARPKAGGWRLGWRSTVHGHFKMQPHGPRSALRKLIWVADFERGPEDAPRKSAIEVVH